MLDYNSVEKRYRFSLLSMFIRMTLFTVLTGSIEKDVSIVKNAF